MAEAADYRGSLRGLVRSIIGKRLSEGRGSTNRAHLESEFTVNEKELNDGFTALNELAKSEYHRSLQDLMTDPPGPFDPSIQVGRLIGVVLKEPFAAAMSLDRPSSHTGAYRAWELDESKFAEPSHRASWQYGVLEQLAEAEGFRNAHNMALEAHQERGFFGCLARSAAKYICGDAKIRREIKRAADEARRSGITLQSPLRKWSSGPPAWDLA